MPPSAPPPLILAHRGSTTESVENTREAFVEARLLGADGVELDVQLSADGALVVHHDPEIPGVGPVAELSVGDLPSSVPLLGEALECCVGMVVNIELKAQPLRATTPMQPDDSPRSSVSGIGALTVAAVEEFGSAVRVIVSSFDVSLLSDVRSIDSRLVLGWLLAWTADAPACLSRAIEAGFGAIHPFVAQVDEALVRDAHAAGLAVHVWTVNAPEDLRAMVALGVDAIITDRVTEAVSVVASRPV